MASRVCRDCGITHEFPRYRLTEPDPRHTLEAWGCAFATGVVILAGTVAFLYAMFLLWPA